MAAACACPCGIAAAAEPALQAPTEAPAALVAQTEEPSDKIVVSAADIALSYGSLKSTGDKELSLTYAGKELRPTVKISVGDSLLVEGTHYALKFLGDGESVGEQQVEVTLAGGRYVTQDSRPIVVSYRIGKLDLSNTGTVSTSPSSSYASSYMYTGARIEPAVTVNANGEALSADLFDVSYPEECTEVNGTSTPYKLTITPKKDGGAENPNIEYGTSRQVSYNITKLNLASAYVARYRFGAADEVVPTYSVSSLAGQTYTGAEIKPAITLKNALNGSEIDPDLYTVRYSDDCTNAGTVTMTIAPKPKADGTWNDGNIVYNASDNDPAAGVTAVKTLTYSINKAQLNSDAVTCAPVADVTYTGGAITPAVKDVRLGDVVLKEGVDYEVSYGTNTAAGTGYVYLTGKGNFNDSSAYRKQVSFKILPKAITAADVLVAPVADLPYTGSAQTPTLVVRDSGTAKALAELTAENQYLYKSYGIANGCDYYVDYADNTDPGTATATVVGIGNYAGVRGVSFRILGTGKSPKVKARNKGNGAVKLTWSPIYGATKYMVQEKMPDGSYKTLSKNWSKPECAVGNLSTTRMHRFLVRAYVGGAWSSASDKLLVSIKPTGPSRPKVEARSKSKTALVLSWKAVPGADRYAIYEKVGKSYQLLTGSYGQTSATINKLSPKGRYSFYVRAYVDGKWTRVAKRYVVTASPADPNPPKAKAVAGVGKGKVKLTWGKARNAKRYKVEAKPEGGTWRTLAKNVKGTAYMARNLDPSKTYTFRVRARGNGTWSKTYSESYASAKPDNA